MPFDPTQPFEVVDAEKPPFDPAKPFEPVTDEKPPFDPSKPVEPATAQDAIQHAVSNPHDKTAREAAWQVFRDEARKPVTVESVAKGTGQFLKGAVPTQDEQGNWHWPLGSALYHFGKGIVSTAGQELGTAAAAAREAAGVIGRVAEGDTLTHAIAATPDDTEGQRLSRQLGAGVESGALSAGRQLTTVGRNISAGANALTGGLIGTQEKDLSDEDLRKRFDEALAYHYAQAKLAEGQYTHEIAQQPAAFESNMRTPEQLAAAGSPINPEQVAEVAGTTSPMNMIEIGGITNPLVQKLAAPALRMTGRAGEAVASRVENAASRAIRSKVARHGAAEGAILDTIITGGAHLPYVAGAAATTGATWIGAKLARNLSTLAREAGDEMLGAAPPMGQGFFRKTLKAGIAGTAGSVPVGATFALTGETPEEAGDSFWSVLGIGGQMGGMHGAAGARATEARAVYDAMSRHGQTVSYGDAADTASQALLAKLHPSVQGMVNYWRGSFDGAQTPDGKPIRVEVVDGDTFRRRAGQDSRGSFHYRDGTLTVKVGETVKGQFIPTDANRIAETFAHEGKHAIDSAMQAAQPELYKAVFEGLKRHFTVNSDGQTATPEFLEWIQGQMQLHLDNLQAAGASEGQIKNALDRLDLSYWLNEASADIGQGLLTGAPLGTFAASPGVVGAIGDAVRDVATAAGVRTPSSGALDLPASQRAIKLIRRQLYRAGAEARERMTQATASGTVRARIAELEPIAATPITPNTTTQERARIRAAQRELDQLRSDIGTTQPGFPAAGAAPVAPSRPAISLPAPTAQNPAAFRLTEAIGDARRALATIIPTGAIKADWMGTRIEDAAAAMTAEGIDPATMTRKQLADELLNRAMGTKPKAKEPPAQPAAQPAQPATPKFTLEPDTKNPGFFYVIDAAGNRVDNQSRTEAGARQSARMLEQGNTGGFTLKPNPIPEVPDIIDAIIEQGGIYLGKMTPEEQEKLIRDPYLRRHISTGNPRMTPDEVARLIAPSETTGGYGDGTQEGLADLIAEAYRVRKEGKGKESPEDAMERYLREQAEKEAAQAPNEPAAPEQNPSEPVPPGRTAVLAGESGADQAAGSVPIQAAPELGDLNQIAATARETFLADKPLAKAGKNKGQHTAANQKAAEKAAFDAVAAAHAETVPLNYQGLRQRVDAFGRRTVSGTVDPSRPFDAWLIERARQSGNLPANALETLLTLQDAIGKTVSYDYGHATVTPEGDMPTRTGRAASQAENTVAKRLAGESPQQIEVKTSVPLRVEFNSGTDSFTVYGASQEKLLNNFNHLAEKMAEAGIPLPFESINDPRFVAAFKAVIANHEHGWKGDGTTPARGTAEYPVTPDPAWATAPEHQIVPKAQFDFINAMLGNESMKSQSPQAKAKAALANENQIDYDPTGEVNELRYRLNAASPEVDGKTWSRRTIEDPLNENISPALASNVREASQSDESIRVHGKVGDLGRFFPKGTTPNRDFSAAGFMPEELLAKVLKSAKQEDALTGSKAWLTPNGRWINVSEHFEPYIKVVGDTQQNIEESTDAMKGAGFARIHYSRGWLGAPNTKELFAEATKLTPAQQRELKNTAIERGAELRTGNRAFMPEDATSQRTSRQLKDIAVRHLGSIGNKWKAILTKAGEPNVKISLGTHGDSFYLHAKIGNDGFTSLYLTPGDLASVYRKPQPGDRDRFEARQVEGGWKIFDNDTDQPLEWDKDLFTKESEAKERADNYSTYNRPYFKNPADKAAWEADAERIQSSRKGKLIMSLHDTDIPEAIRGKGVLTKMLATARQVVGKDLAEKSLGVHMPMNKEGWRTISRRAGLEPRFMPEDANASPKDKARARMADREGVLYQGEANGLVAFKDQETNGNFSLPAGKVTPEAIREAAKKVRESFAAKEAIDTPEKLEQWMREQGMQFMPDTGTPAEGGTPGERLAREAEQADIPLSVAVIRGLMIGDQETMDRLRARIEQKTGKPAQFMPESKPERTNYKDAARQRQSQRQQPSNRITAAGKRDDQRKTQGAAQRRIRERKTQTR